ncbi:enoyl-CoA hydratase-related protein [Janibacter limosus]|uniref:Enoyl-CoA hydratase-related protein n=1 Tax=Janibacter limosus TaxID=53458 RepID=A0AC61U6K9_9MICO|nr:enoyl-CoA hydratase-related protein [Janibacter limosus]UUZ45682.1 enoyl-CoA hydratase-related protein [Janibacter limosus]
MGLVSDVVPDEDPVSATDELARTVASASSATVAIGKRAFYDQIDLPIEAAYEQMTRVMVDNSLTPDAREGIGAFLDKREPQWQHRV